MKRKLMTGCGLLLSVLFIFSCSLGNQSNRPDPAEGVTPPPSKSPPAQPPQQQRQSVPAQQAKSVEPLDILADLLAVADNRPDLAQEYRIGLIGCADLCKTTAKDMAAWLMSFGEVVEERASHVDAPISLAMLAIVSAETGEDLDCVDLLAYLALALVED